MAGQITVSVSVIPPCSTHTHAPTSLALALLTLFAKVWLANDFYTREARKGKRRVDTRLGQSHCILSLQFCSENSIYHFSVVLLMMNMYSNIIVNVCKGFISNE